MNTANKLEKAGEWLHERLPVEKLTFDGLVRKKEVPVHRMSWAYYLGGLALFFFSIQLATGLLLLFYYQPTVADAHAPVEYITRHVTGGALIRNMHTWSSGHDPLPARPCDHHLRDEGLCAAQVTWVSGVRC